MNAWPGSVFLAEDDEPWPEICRTIAEHDRIMGALGLTARGILMAPKGAHDRFLTEYSGRPKEFFKDAFDLVLTDQQEEVLRCLLEGEHPETWVHSGHGTGKTTIAGLAAEYWFSVLGRPVLTTAPTGHQVRNLLWGQVIQPNRLLSRLPLPGRLLETCQVKTNLAPVDEEGARKPPFMRGVSTDKPERMQGVHADHLLVIVDECAGVTPAIYRAIKGYFTNIGVRLLCIGNPPEVVDKQAEFYKACFERSDQVQVVHLDAELCPHVDPAWLEARRAEWGADSIEYRTRVKGLWPLEETGNLLLTQARVLAAQAFWTTLPPEDPAEPWEAWALDVARRGHDKNSLAGRRGRRGHILRWWKETNTYRAAEQVFAMLVEADQHGVLPGYLVVDCNAVGGPVLDALEVLILEHDLKGCELVPFDWNGKTTEPLRFVSARDEVFWALRDALREPSLALPPVAELTKLGISQDVFMRQMTVRRTSLDPKGRHLVEGKNALIKRKARESPDIPDSLAMLYAPEVMDVAPIRFF